MIRIFVFLCLLSLSAPIGMPNFLKMKENPYRVVTSDKGLFLVQQDNDKGETVRKDGAEGSEALPEADSPSDPEDSTKVAPKNQINI